MASFRIPYLTVKPLAGGGYGYYWEPSPALRKKGWKRVAFGIAPTDSDPALLEAARARNREVEAWRTAGAAPRAVKRFTQRRSFADLVALYKESDEWKSLRASTQATYGTAITILETWATLDDKPGGYGNLAVASIGRDRIEKLRDTLKRPAKPGDRERLHRANGTLRVLGTLLAFAIGREWITANPVSAVSNPAPPPRDQIWEDEDVAAFCAAAEFLKLPSLAFAIELASYTGQREADLLALTRANWKPVRGLDAEQRAALAGPDGVVMGIQLKQGKTRRWVGVPIAGELRSKLETAIADNARRDMPTARILIYDRTGLPWRDRFGFWEAFDEVRALAIAPTAKARAAGLVARPELARLQFRDLRRTCVVRLGELGLEDALIAAITGHGLATIKAILEIYMPRTDKMAARAVVARIGAGIGHNSGNVPGHEQRG